MVLSQKQVIIISTTVLPLSLLLFFVPLVSFAQVDIVPIAPPGTRGPIESIDQGIGLFRQTLTWFAILFWIGAAFFVFYAAFLYLTAAGDEKQVQKASSQLLYAIIAIAVGLMAYGLPAFVSTFLSGDSGGQEAIPAEIRRISN